MIGDRLNHERAGFDRNTIRRTLLGTMTLYKHFTTNQQGVIDDFVEGFYSNKSVYFHPAVQDRDQLLIITAANAALVGAAQATHYFSSVKWLYFCLDDLDVDGDALGESTVRLHAIEAMREGRGVVPGQNIIVHEFAHVLDNQFGLSGGSQGIRNGFSQFQRDCAAGRDVPIALHPLESSSQPEFFAAASEAFFTDAAELKHYHAGLYQDLCSIYGVDLSRLNWDEIAES